MTTSWQIHRLLFGCLSFPDTIGETNWGKCNYSPCDSDWLKIPHLSQLAHGILPASMIIQGLADDQIQANEAQEDTFGVLLKENHQKRWFLSSSGYWGMDLSPRGAAAPSTSLRIKPPCGGGELKDSQEKMVFIGPKLITARPMGSSFIWSN